MAVMFLFRILSKLPSQKVTLFRSTMTAFRPMQTVSFLSELPFGEHGGLLLRTRTACKRRARAGPRAREDPSYKAALTERSWRRLCSPRTLQASCTGPGSSTAQRPAGAGLRGPTRHRKLPRKAEGLSRVGPRSAAGRKIIPHAFTFPGALAAAGWGLPGLWGTGESREQGHVPACRQ